MNNWNGMIIIVAMGLIAVLVGVALTNGIDGMLLAGAFTIIGGLAGYAGKTVRDKRKGVK